MGKTEKIIFYAFIFLLPFQIGTIVFSFAPFENFFHHQLFVYLSDFFIITLLGFWSWRILKDGQEREACFAAIKKDFLLILFLSFASLSVFAAANKGLAIFHLAKLFEFVLFYFYVRQNFRYIDIKKFSLVLVTAALLQVFVADLQFHFQQSIGLKYLGESPLSLAISGVAKIDENGFKLIRSYGTFPHPNIFAAFLIFAAFMTYYDALLNASLMRHKKYAAFMTHLVPVFAVLLGLFLTFSKIAILSFVSSSFLFFGLLLKKYFAIEKGIIKRILWTTFAVFVALFIVFNQEIINRFSNGIEDSSIKQRIFYIDVAKDAIASSPIFGAGIGNFTDYFYNRYPDLPDWQYQPVHNLFLLIVSETGIISGFLIIVFIAINIFRFFKDKNRQLFDCTIFFVFLNFLILANFDHYFWTIQQGQILLWLALGLLNNRQ